jgi:anti-sigma B factor antagonist
MGATRQPQPSPDPAKAPTPALTLTHHQLPSMTLVCLDGELDRNTSAQLADYLDHVHRTGDHVVFDLTELRFCDSSGLHVILARARACASTGASAHLAGVCGAPARLLQITGVDRHLPVHTTVQQAITAALATRRR